MADDDGVEILTEAECLELLSMAEIGRIGVTIDALPAIFPVNYRLIDGSVVFRTGPGAKLRAALDRTVVAFEVDQLDHDHRAGWSVLIVGVAEELDPEESVSVPRALTPWAPGERSHTIRIRPEVLTGRRVDPDGRRAP